MEGSVSRDVAGESRGHSWAVVRKPVAGEQGRVGGETVRDQTCSLMSG